MSNSKFSKQLPTITQILHSMWPSFVRVGSKMADQGDGQKKKLPLPRPKPKPPNTNSATATPTMATTAAARAALEDQDKEEDPRNNAMLPPLRIRSRAEEHEEDMPTTRRARTEEPERCPWCSLPATVAKAGIQVKAAPPQLGASSPATVAKAGVQVKAAPPLLKERLLQQRANSLMRGVS